MYAVSNEQSGPWLGECERPEHALEKGRAMYGNVRLYVAEIRAVKLSDGFKNVHVLLGDVRENLVESFGSGCDEFMDDPKFKEQERGIAKMISLVLDDAVEESGVVITGTAATQIRSYGPDQSVKTGHFPSFLGTK